MVNLKQIWEQNKSLSESIIVLAQSILIQGYEQAAGQIFRVFCI